MCCVSKKKYIYITGLSKNEDKSNKKIDNTKAKSTALLYQM